MILFAASIAAAYMDGHGAGAGAAYTVCTVLLEATPLKDSVTRTTGEVLFSLRRNETKKNGANVVYVTV